MRTTVRLDPTLVQRAKQLAVGRRSTLTSLIEEGLRWVLARSEAPLVRARVVLPTGAGDGLRPGIDLDDRSAFGDSTFGGPMDGPGAT